MDDQKGTGGFINNSIGFINIDPDTVEDCDPLIRAQVDVSKCSTYVFPSIQ